VVVRSALAQSEHNLSDARSNTGLLAVVPDATLLFSFVDFTWNF
jgi:hypothetical protein